MNEFWAILASALVTTLPVAADPSLIVTYSNVETAVVSYLYVENQTEASVDCGNGKLTISPDKEFEKSCTVTNLKTEAIFNTDITLYVVDTTVTVKAVIKSQTGEEIK